MAPNKAADKHHAIPDNFTNNLVKNVLLDIAILASIVADKNRISLF